MARAELDPEVVAKFAETFKVQERPDFRVEEEGLFLATRSQNGNVERMYVEPDGNKFRLIATAWFVPEQRLPRLVGVRLNPEEPWDIAGTNATTIMIQEFPDNDKIDLSYSTATDHFASEDGTSIHVDINRLKDRIGAIGLKVGGKWIDSDFIRRVPRNKIGREAYLAEKGIMEDKKAGTAQLTLSDWRVEAQWRVRTEEVLQALFPEQLRADHFGTPSAMDGWSQQGLFEAFGVIITPPGVERDIFAK